MPARRNSTEDLSPFGREFVAWLKRKGLSQDAVARMIRTNQRTLSDWTTVDRMPAAVPALLKLGALMGLSLEDLLDVEGELAPLRDPVRVREMVRDAASPRVLKRFLAKEKEMREAPREKKPATSKMKRRRRTK